MVTQDDDIEVYEQLLRRIPNNPSFIDLTLRDPVQRAAFRPTNEDVDGISVYREMFISAEEIILVGTSRYGYFVARLPVEEILEEGLTIIPDPQTGGLPGHSLIPDIKIQDYDSPKGKFASRAKQAKLARIINRDYKTRIVLFPDS